MQDVWIKCARGNVLWISKLYYIKGYDFTQCGSHKVSIFYLAHITCCKMLFMPSLLIYCRLLYIIFMFGLLFWCSVSLPWGREELKTGEIIRLHKMKIMKKLVGAIKSLIMFSMGIFEIDGHYFSLLCKCAQYNIDGQFYLIYRLKLNWPFLFFVSWKWDKQELLYSVQR